MKTFILDASVIVKWYSSQEEKNLKKAEKIFFDLEEGKIKAKTTDLLVHELANALLKGKLLEQKETAEALQTFFQTKVEIIPTDFALIKKAIFLAAKYDLTAYDAIYLALAKRLNGCLISANPRCHGKLKDGSVVLLKDY